MKKILITGAAGFLGSHLCERFLKEKGATNVTPFLKNETVS